MEQERREEQMQKIDQLIEKTSYLLKGIQQKGTLDERLSFLRKSVNVPQIPFLESYIEASSLDVQYLLFSLFAIGQAPVIFDGADTRSNKERLLDEIVRTLHALEVFYAPLGGIIGYQLKVLELMRDAFTGSNSSEEFACFPPPVCDVRQENSEIQKLIISGILALDQIGELYAVGGAGDRLNLIEDKTRRLLPAANLRFLGRTLLEGLVRDLEAREYLYYKFFHKVLKTPIVLMTSEEKMNDKEIFSILEQANWFGRGRENFLQFVQPLTPVVTIDGDWAVSAPLELFLKPGGHGVIWKLASDKGVFEWLEKGQRSCLIVRQINNPLAGLDYGLLALSGYAVEHNMAFGFASCPRRPDAAEGMNVLKKTKTKSMITNLEYTEFSKSAHKSLKIELFPANTNILFARIQDIKEAVLCLPIPGMIVNMKLPVQTMKHKKIVERQGARLESTMQNIADALNETNTFITLNERAKTISVTKNTYDSKNGGKISDTPEGAFYDLLLANRGLLVDRCDCRVAELNAPDEYIKQGPSVLFLYHPALGPLYSVIAEKIRHCRLYESSELLLE
ncbi:MAG: hypothetical protein JWO53_202, partial [Chlamydiia bacterium]|nr:hypothetical protein [Chlamydiia bacterium]